MHVCQLRVYPVFLELSMVVASHTCAWAGAGLVLRQLLLERFRDTPLLAALPLPFALHPATQPRRNNRLRQYIFFKSPHYLISISTTTL